MQYFNLLPRTLCVTFLLVFSVLAHPCQILPDHLSATAEIQADKPLKIAYVIKAQETGNPYWPRVISGAKQAARDFGVEVSVHVPDKENYDVQKQIAMINKLGKSDVDGLVLIPIDTRSLVNPVEDVIAAGKPVLIHDTPLDSKRTITQLSFDNFDAGLKIGRWLNSELKGEGEVVILEGQAQSLNAVERRNGFLSGLAEGNVSVMDIRPANWNRDTAFRLVSDWLKTLPNLKAILASSDSMALGAMEAVERAGRKNMIIAGIDASEEVLNAIETGKIRAAVDQVPEKQSRKAVQLLLRHLQRGDCYPATSVWQDSPLITRDNVDQFLKDN